MARLTTRQLHQRFIESLGGHIVSVETDLDQKPLEFYGRPPLPSRMRVYLSNLTNPQGGRPTPEHKIQFIAPGQVKGTRANFDFSGDRAVVVAGYGVDEDVFVLWDAYLHHDFPHSANAQVQSHSVYDAVETGTMKFQERRLQSGEEELVIVAPPDQLVDALVRRFDITPTMPVPTVPAAIPQAARARGRRYLIAPAGPRPEPKTRVFEVDPDLIDRGTLAHRAIQDALRDTAQAAGLEPLSPNGVDPQFDIAWITGTTAWVIEVKSVTRDNEIRQLRLAIGQVLSYCHFLDWAEIEALAPVIAIERPPTDMRWVAVCGRVGIRLVSPATFHSLFD